jgi:cysteine-rich repeat protein
MRSSKFGVLIAHLLCSVTWLACGSIEGTLKSHGTRGETPTSEDFGALDLSLTLPVGVPVQAVDYALIGQSTGQRVNGTVSLGTSAGVGAFLGGLPEDVYTIQMAATLTSGVICAGQSTVQVVADQSVQLHIVLTCGGTQLKNSGLVINGDIDLNATCAFDSVFVSPTRVIATSPVQVSAAGQSTNGPVEYVWRGPGAFADPRNPTTRYTCSAVLGVQTLSVTLTDVSGCQQTIDVEVECLPQGSCGDGLVQFGETCDDGNVNSEDGCSPLCLLESCGDGVIQQTRGEVCDPPDGLRCRLDCQYPPHCAPDETLTGDTVDQATCVPVTSVPAIDAGAVVRDAEVHAAADASEDVRDAQPHREIEAGVSDAGQPTDGAIHSHSDAH